jgi:hypothetical protein
MLSVVAVALTLVFATAATADTIYLKSGRSIRTSQVRVEGDRVYFIQFGGEVSVPLSVVDRIVEDARVEPEGSPPRPTPTPPATGDAAATPAASAAGEGEAAEQQTQRYWQDRVRTIEAEKEQVALQIEDFKRTERAFLFSQRSTAETRQKIAAAEQRLVELDQEASDLQTEARRLGVPAGWLRLPPRGGEGGGGGASSGV